MLERLVDHLQTQSLGLGYLAVFGLLLAAGFGFPLPEDVPLIAGGVLAWLASPLETVTLRTMLADRGFQVMVAVGMSGILVGDSVIYLAGRRLGRRVAEVWPFRKMITPEKLERVERLLRQRGKVVVMVARFLPGLRAPTYFTVGHSRVPFWEFLLFDGLAALLSAPLWVALGFWFGDDIERAARAGSEFGSWILGGVLVIVAVLLARAWLRRRRERRQRSEG
ncbi:MAG TPA: DedA family protein [Anaeromyxobacteraceae bacterium]|nr:DedA family protein [Anaeromyxobacteraceae bacterium]